MGDSITNETLAALMTQHHAETSRRLDKIDAKVAETNGRLGKAETAIAVLQFGASHQPAKVEHDEDSVPVPKKWIALGFTAGAGLVGGAVKLISLLK